jgi:hypothetical protein
MLPRKKKEAIDYDLLDPCCQKEIDEEKKTSKVTKELRKNDRSNIRYDMTVSALEKLKNAPSLRCHCCTEPIDYPILIHLRILAEQDEFIKEVENNHDNSDLEEDSDSDMDELLDTVFITPFEQDRIEQMRIANENKALTIALGYGSHREDSVDHINAQILEKQNVIIHIFDSKSYLSGNIDLYFENISQEYIGTKFRRISNIQSPQFNNFIKQWDLQNEILSESLFTGIACFIDGQKVSSTCNLSQFGDEDSLYRYELKKYLEHSHVLTTDLSVAMLANASVNNGSNKFSRDGDEENEEESVSYCDIEGCNKKFAHEHIGGKGGNSLGGASGSQGSEALARNTFNRV